MKESLLNQLKRNLSNRSRKGKENQQRPETPNTPKFLDVDGDARSTYSVESDSKSFFSFSFENTESKSLCDFEPTPYGDTKHSRKFSFEKAVENDYPPPPYDIDRLEWILFYPEGVGRRFVGMLGINDVVAMSQVCRAWRKWLVPDRETGYNSLEKIEAPQNSRFPFTKGGLRWHPLVQTVIAATPPSQASRYSIEPLGFYGRYHRQSILHWQKYEFSIPRLIGVFGEIYLSAITSLHLDGVALEMESNWLRYCTNLESLSIRRCAGITLDKLVDLVLGPEEENQGGSSKKKKQKTPVHISRPENLRILRFWGIDGVRQLAYPHNSDQYLSDRQKLERLCERLMERYETDVNWCFDGEGCFVPREDRSILGNDPKKKYRLLMSMAEACGVCGTARRDLGWEDGVTCERCLGLTCKGCLRMKTVSKVKDDGGEDHDISNPPAANMLQLICYQGRTCGWEGGEHHVHPECIPPASLLWGHNDPLKHVFELYAHLQGRSSSLPS
ncbi:hypothetical protein TWF281_011165 [Arthrobotrys megalospora]